MVITKRFSLLIKQFYIYNIMLEYEQTKSWLFQKLIARVNLGTATSTSSSVLIPSHLVGADINNIIHSTLHISLVTQLSFLLANIFIVNRMDTVYL
jgi:hypothetical protein